MAGPKTTQTPSTNPAAERIRENQRRSRARRKEFVEAMQRRLDEYEKQGVEATLQMQQAARTVAIENSRLRLLLARRGVTDHEVDKFLAMFETGIPRDDEILQPPGGNGSLQTVIPPPSAPAPTTYSQQPPPATTTTTSPYQQYHSDGGIDRLAVLADASISDRCCGSGASTVATTPTESTVAAQSPPSTGPSTMPGTPVSGPHGQYHSHIHSHSHHHHSHHHHGTAQAQAESASPLVMSCNTAAQIIAEMQGGTPVNRHAVKASMGCPDAECECFVKNTLLFQIMEKSAA
ncbi:hypothetical protein ISF_01421 [Cordyceps fumosorosea ARSEF 2679]|uniref:Uncharacterized protein n=1 Tax=Cordyceps fumosorosea (strain ARSEF 2679) TaxID=1081104 RepID=A0A168DA65_CORFA|nr:hypothetical protein ISF_01421 [Cordyceps fumosorosea ARSEF 2679]OAA72348.1 hypothetical protein ISF_01421 [Cordyceps fumosorosea ARSEF 2679]